MSTSCRRKNSSPGTERSSSMALLGYALLAFNSIARRVLQESRSASLKQPIEGVYRRATG